MDNVPVGHPCRNFDMESGNPDKQRTTKKTRYPYLDLR